LLILPFVFWVVPVGLFRPGLDSIHFGPILRLHHRRQPNGGVLVASIRCRQHHAQPGNGGGAIVLIYSVARDPGFGRCALDIAKGQIPTTIPVLKSSNRLTKLRLKLTSGLSYHRRSPGRVPLRG
jgi:hypothetical protein